MKARLLLFIIALVASDALDEKRGCFAQTGDWKTVTSTGIIHRHECTMAEVNGKFYLMGGRGIKKTNIYDPSSGNWTTGSNNPPFQMHHFQAVPYNGKIYIMAAFTGGHPAETPVDKIYIYDPQTDTWNEGPSIPEDRRRGAAGAVVYNNKIYVVGGATNGHIGGNVGWLDEYDPATGTWTSLADAPQARDHFQAVVAGDKLYVAGGRRSKGTYDGKTFTNLDEYFSNVDVYDFTTGQWDTSYPDIPTKRAGTAAVLLDKEILVIGGESPASKPPLPAHNNTEALNIETKTWRTLAPLDTGRHATHAVVYSGKVYIASGSKSNGGSGSSELYSMEQFSLSPVQQNELQMTSELDFGQVNKGESKLIRLFIKNVSPSAAISISNISIDNNPGNEFEIMNLPSLPVSLAANQVLTLEIQLTPVSSGDKSSSLKIAHTGSNGPSTVNLKGEGTLKVTGVASSGIFNAVVVYPNPSKNIVTVKNLPGALDWEILNSQGVVMTSGKSTATNSALINLEGLLPGVYILSLSNSEGARQSYVIKKE